MKKMYLFLLLLVFATGALQVKAQWNTPGGPCLNYGEYGASSIYCMDYFICESNYIWYRHTCPEGLEFNDDTATCDYPNWIFHSCGCSVH